MIINDMKTE